MRCLRVNDAVPTSHAAESAALFARHRQVLLAILTILACVSYDLALHPFRQMPPLPPIAQPDPLFYNHSY